MIMPTLVNVRKNSSSSSMAIIGAGTLPFITPTSMIWRGSTCPSSPFAGRFGQGAAPPLAAAKLLPETQSASGTRPIAPLNENGAAAPPVVFDLYGYEVTELVIASVVAGSPGTSVPPNTVLKVVGNSVPGRPAVISAMPESGPNAKR